MKTILCAIAAIIAAGAAIAAPAIPSSEMPGRERQRFMETPIDRYMDPLARPRNVEPLYRWKCEGDQSRQRKRPQQSRRKKDC